MTAPGSVQCGDVRRGTLRGLYPGFSGNYLRATAIAARFSGAHKCLNVQIQRRIRLNKTIPPAQTRDTMTTSHDAGLVKAVK
jgi:hypothetical protein